MHANTLRVAGWLLMVAPALAQVATPAARKAPTTAAAAAIARPDVSAGILSARTERVAPDRATLTLATKLEAGAKYRLLDPDAREVPLKTAADGTIKAEVDPRRGYVLTTQTDERVKLAKDGVQFPGRYVTFAPTGATNLGGLFLRPAAVPLTWNEQSRAYATELLVGYEFTDGGERPLAAPKTVTFFAEGANARVQADTVRIERSGGSGYKRVVLTTGQVDGETHFTARVGPGDELKASVTVRREVGALKLSLPSTDLVGFGIGSASLTVGVVGRDGMPLAVPSPVEVQLSSRHLRQPSTLTVPEGKSSVTADVRSAGIGTDEIVAESGAFRASLPVRLVFPVAPIVAAVVGGLLGGCTRYLRNRRKASALLLRRALEGALVGVIIVGAVWAGLVSVDVSTGILGTPFGGFVLAALSGYLGCVVLDRVANRTFPGKATA